MPSFVTGMRPADLLRLSADYLLVTQMRHPTIGAKNRDRRLGNESKPLLLVQITDSCTVRRWQRDECVLPPFKEWERFMCEKCVQPNEKIVRTAKHSRSISPTNSPWTELPS